jgi:CelD/BcsL family acetyltransferase involved in cellulose biosynthesis
MLVPNWSLMDVSLIIPDAGIGRDWQELAGRALVPSGHNAPELVIPAVTRQPGAVLATVRDLEGLQLALPLRKRRIPFALHASLSTPISFYGLPHVGRYMAVPALMALLRKVRQPVLLHSVPVDGVFWDMVAASAARTAVVASWERAALRPNGSYADWFEENFDRKRRKEYRRLAARLGEQGVYSSHTYAWGDEAGEWTSQFLDLEARGWKGRRGTALKADKTFAAGLRDGLLALASSGKLRFWKLALDGRPIAMMFGIVEGREAWLGKIAYDEDFARFSPGVQLILHATEDLFREEILLADSCAIPDHPMINHLWRDRIRVADVMLAGPDVSPFVFTATLAAERIRRSLRSTARTAYYRLSGRRPS